VANSVGYCPSGVAICSRNSANGLAKLNLTVVSSTFSTLQALPPITIAEGGDLNSSVFLAQSSIENRMSSAVNGLPSDHFMPLRRWNVNSVAFALTSQRSATHGSTSVKARFQRTSP
jgi:hypothetical protein